MLGPLVLFLGIVYHYTTTQQTTRAVYTSSGTMWLDGQRYRFEADPGEGSRSFDVAISTDGDQTAAFYHKNSNTWTERSRLGSTRSSLLFHLPFPGDRLRGTPKVTHTVEPSSDTIAGVATEKHVVDVDYALQVNYDNEIVRGSVHTRIEVWSAPTLPALPFRRDVRTGFGAIDDAIAKALEKVNGMVLRHELTVTRTMEDGPAITEVTRTVVDKLQQQEIPEEKFRRE